MKNGCFLFLFVLFFGTSLQADVTESFVVQGSFELGLGGLNPGDQTSTNSYFASSPASSGSVEARDPRSILAGNGNVAFTADAGVTRVNFDMGAEMDETNLSAVLVASKIFFGGIDFDGGSDSFTFDFTAKFLDGSSITDISDLSITTTNGSIGLVNLDGGRFAGTVTPTGSGSAELEFSSTTGSPLRSIQFRKITPDFAADELLISGNRTLDLVAAVPEPAGTIIVGSMLVITLTRRRKFAL